MSIAESIRDSTNYFLIISREPLPELAYSVDSVFTLDTNGKDYWLKPLYDTTLLPCTPDFIITEDAGSGFEFF